MGVEARTSASPNTTVGVAQSTLSCVFNTLDFIYVSFRRLIPYDRIGLALLDESGKVIRQVWQRADDPALLMPIGYSARVADGSLSRIIDSGRPRILSDLPSYALAHPDSASTGQLVRRGVKSSLTCPLAVDGRPFGVLFFSSREISAYSESHVRTFVALTSEVAPLLDPHGEPPSFGDVVAHLAVHLDRIHHEEQIIEAIARRVHHGSTLDEVMGELFDALDEIVPFDRIGVALLEKEGTVLRARWARSRVQRVEVGFGYTLELNRTSLAALIESGKPRVINDLLQYLSDHPTSASTALIVREGMRASLTCPLIDGGRAVGFVFFSSTHINAYGSTHGAVMERIAAEIAHAIGRSADSDVRAADHQFSESLLTELLPKPVLRALRTRRTRVAEHVPDAGILFIDIQGFTSWSMQSEPHVMVTILDRLFRDFDRLCDVEDVHKLRTIGDAYMVVSGVPAGSSDHFPRLATVALQMIEVAGRTLDPLGRPIVVRGGIACGSVVAGVLGGRVPHYDVWGPCVNLASRLQSISSGQQLCVDIASAMRLTGQFALSSLGPHALKGVGTIEVLAIAERG